MACSAIVASNWLIDYNLKACAFRFGLVESDCQLASYWLKVVVCCQHIHGSKKMQAGISLVDSGCQMAIHGQVVVYKLASVLIQVQL